MVLRTVTVGGISLFSHGLISVQHFAVSTTMRSQRRRAANLGRNRPPPCLRWLAIVGVGTLLATISIPLIGITAVTAAEKDHALLVNQIGRYITLSQGKSVTVWFDFQNTGTSTWNNSGAHPVSLVTDNPIHRTSVIQSRIWKPSWRPAKLLQKLVKPGETGRVRFAITAPKKIGVWTEKFTLVRDDGTVIPGGQAEFVVVVGKKADASVLYRAVPLKPILSFTTLPGGHITQTVDFKNVGYGYWRSEGYSTTTLVPAIGLAQAIDSSSSTIPVGTLPAISKTASRRESTSAALDLTAPSEPGTYKQNFGLLGPFGLIAGSAFTVNLTVLMDPPPPLNSEPILRVGICAPSFTGTTLTRPFVLGSNGTFEARAADTNAVLASFDAGQTASLQFDSSTQQYTLTAWDGTKTTSSAAIRFLPTSDETILEIQSCTSLGSYTKFRGLIEAHYSPTTGKLWTINELPIEQYLLGLGETGSASPDEFVKTLVTAARSYALYKIYNGTSHDAEFFNISSATDQVYHGYVYELKTPNITRGVIASRGLVVIHPSMVSQWNPIGAILAAYSSCTDGRTRSYEERWGGTPGKYSYLVSVSDPDGVCTDGGYPASYMTGGGGNHMVGMSAFGALRSYTLHGTAFDAVLTYYYTGTSILRAYL